ncbi:MAG: rod-binding protein [Treponema sp.]|nr:rod-binding protein [Treponema sp.]
MDISSFGTLQGARIQLDMMQNDLTSAASAVRGQGTFTNVLERVMLSSNEETHSAIRRPGVSAEIDRDSELFQLTLELETFIVKNLLSSMRNTVQRSGLIDTGFAGEIYEDMLWDEYARIFTRSAGFGLAEQAYKQLRGLR